MKAVSGRLEIGMSVDTRAAIDEYRATFDEIDRPAICHVVAEAINSKWCTPAVMRKAKLDFYEAGRLRARSNYQAKKLGEPVAKRVKMDTISTAFRIPYDSFRRITECARDADVKLTFVLREACRLYLLSKKHGFVDSEVI